MEHMPSFRLLLWFCRIVLRIAAENWGRIFQNPVSPGMFLEIKHLGAEIDNTLWPPDGKPPKPYKD